MNRILYVPLDERACNYEFPALLAGMTEDVALVEPPVGRMGFKKKPADIDALWAWLFENAGQCSHAILSVDTLVYGNIINSRTHHRPLEACMETLSRFTELKRKNPELSIHAFNLVARVAAYDSAAEDPDYWASYGRKIWRYACLTDKAERGEADEAERGECAALRREIPDGVLDDFLARRAVDRAVNLACVDLVRDGVFDVLTVPKDDTAEYGYAALDQMAIAKRVRELRLPDRVFVYPGADEVGSVLFARVFNQIKNYRPRIYIRYSSVYGPFIVPRYEDRPLQEGIKAQITSLGGVVLDAPGDSDCMLAVNSPGKHMIESVEQYTKDLTFSTHLNLNELFRYMRYYHEEYGRPVGLAEVSVANGCENVCMELGLLTGTYDYLTAVGGWNTAQNTIGVVLAQLVIASYYNGFCGRPEQLRRSEEFMASRLASDWLYQSNVLHRYLVETAGTVDPYALGRHYGDAAEYFRHGLQALLDEKFTAGIRGRRPIVDTLQFQWDGIFYIRLHVRLEEVLRAEGTKEKTDTGE